MVKEQNLFSKLYICYRKPSFNCILVNKIQFIHLDLVQLGYGIDIKAKNYLWESGKTH